MYYGLNLIKYVTLKKSTIYSWTLLILWLKEQGKKLIN